MYNVINTITGEVLFTSPYRAIAWYYLEELSKAWEDKLEVVKCGI